MKIINFNPKKKKPVPVVLPVYQYAHSMWMKAMASLGFRSMQNDISDFCFWNRNRNIVFEWPTAIDTSQKQRKSRHVPSVYASLVLSRIIIDLFLHSKPPYLSFSYIGRAFVRRYLRRRRCTTPYALAQFESFAHSFVCTRLVYSVFFVCLLLTPMKTIIGRLLLFEFIIILFNAVDAETVELSIVSLPYHIYLVSIIACIANNKE